MTTSAPINIIDAFCEEMRRIVSCYREHYSAAMPTEVCVATSGGSDSMSLLIMSMEWARRNGVQVSCVTVDHKLRKESTTEAEFVKKFCLLNRIEHTVLSWHRNDIKPLMNGKIENLAREARYQLISQFCEEKKIPFVLVGHTWDDQLETFEIRKNAGSSWIGLACMSQIRSLSSSITLLRPLLHFRRNHLKKFLSGQNIVWLTDPMNDQECFLRVAYRKRISSYSSNRITSISNKILEYGKMRNRIEKSAVRFLDESCKILPSGYAMIREDCLHLEEKTVQIEVLRRVIWSIGGKKYATAIKSEILDNILSGKINTLGRCLLKIKKGIIYISRENREKSQLSLPERNHKIAFEDSSLIFLDKIHLCDVFL
ncbi:MAG: tRNA lysidine(34) synthetase TilS [Holosporaceae bacterium]|nr:tRNA lysidine(34) synthetase TilS [Holosporaceae bacterium]